jgi:3'-phosphoadenosine 5'-phosphosulfate (PAPS) 3'-phosphatase
MILPGYKVAPTSSSSLLPVISIWPYCNMDESYFVLACEFHQVFLYTQQHCSSAAVYTVLHKRNSDCEAFCVRRYHTMPATRTALNRGLYKCMLLRHTTNNSQEKFDLKVFLAATLHLPLHRIRMSPRSVSIASSD